MITPEEIAENQRQADIKAAQDHTEYEHQRAQAGIEMVLPRSGKRPPPETVTEAPVTLEFGPEKPTPMKIEKTPVVGKKPAKKKGKK